MFEITIYNCIMYCYNIIVQREQERKIIMFQVVEIGRGIRETYTVKMTDAEMSSYLKGKREMIGYIPGLGGDTTYSIVAWHIGNEGQGYIDLERIWRLYGSKVA